MENNKKTIAILGANGMLGSMVYNVLKDNFNLIVFLHGSNKLPLLEKAYGSINPHESKNFDFNLIYDDYVKGFKNLGASPRYREFLDELGNVDGIVNCAGIIIPHSLKDCSNTFFINSALPHLLADTFGSKLIHITTDCVFGGSAGFPYDENSLPSPTDLYGLSKSLGEPQNCLTLRTSIVGPEIEGFFSLLGWFKRQEGKTINGYRRHFWNGITTREFGNICAKIFKDRSDYPQNGIYHVFSNVVSKYEMLLKFREKYDIDCEIIADDSTELNRTLSTVKELNSRLAIPDFDKMLKVL
ncbi:MAG: sugar nucleotide-binding protein [Candidatus Nealsonbacteria bacterium]|nr:sugar nucleotide-binding protein [Candidatus Nealsonbacteria bacterium]